MGTVGQADKKKTPIITYLLVTVNLLLLFLFSLFFLNYLRERSKVAQLEEAAGLPETGEVVYVQQGQEEAIETVMIVDQSVTSEKIAEGAVTEGTLAESSVTTVKLADGSVNLIKLSPSICITGQVLKKSDDTTWECAEDETGESSGEGRVESIEAGLGLNESGTTTESILNVNVDGSTIEIVTDEVTLADNAVTTGKILDGTILFADISQNACGSNQIMKWNGSAWACANDDNTSLSEAQVEGYLFDDDNTGTLESGTLALDLVSYSGTLDDTNVNDALSISAAGSVADGALSSNVSLLGSSIDLTSEVSGILPLANGGTGASLTDPGSDMIMFWDDDMGTIDWLTAGSNLTITGTTLDASDQYTGTVTSVDSGNGLTGGPVTGSGTLSVNSPTCAGTDKLQWNGSAFACSADVDTTYTAGNDLDLSGTTFDIEGTLNYVSVITQDSGDLTLSTTTSGDVILNPVGTVKLEASGDTDDYIYIETATNVPYLYFEQGNANDGGFRINGTAIEYRDEGGSWTALNSIGGEEETGQIAAFAGSCPSGWSEYAAARGRVIVGNPSGGTVTTTQGTAFTSDNETRTITSVPAHTHSVNPPNTSTSDAGAHTHNLYAALNSGSNHVAKSGTSSAGWWSGKVSTAPNHSHTVDIAQFTSGSTGSASVDVTMPYIQLTWCSKDAGSDYAEWIESNEEIDAGMVVSVDADNDNKVVKSKEAYDRKVLGIISTQPGWLLGTESATTVKLAVAGQVPVKVTLSNGDVKRGDPIAASDIEGTGMKATNRYGKTIGTALSELNSNSSNLYKCGDNMCGEVTIFLNPSWYNPMFVSPKTYLLTLGGIGIVAVILIALKKKLYKKWRPTPMA